MPNHYHLIVKSASEDALRRMMQSAMAAYGRYFNARYRRDGPLWRGRYRAKPLATREDLLRATAYVHLNHDDDPDYAWSAHRYMVREPAPEWLAADELAKAIGGATAYHRYIEIEIAARKRKREIDTDAKPTRPG